MPAWEPVVLVVERKDPGGGAAHDAFPLYGAVITGIKAVVAIVPHHEVMPLRHAARPEVPHSSNRRPCCDDVGPPRELFRSEDMAGALGRRPIAQRFTGHPAEFDRRAVENQRI